MNDPKKVESPIDSRKRAIEGGAVLALAYLVLTIPVIADSISPTTFNATVNVGGTATVHKTVTISAGTPTTAKADVFFLSDTTGSMGSAISAVKTSSGAILNTLSGDIAFGVGEYKDVTDSFAYKLDSNITTSKPATQAGINLWSASGGGDIPEANLFGLQQVATTTSWRAGAKRILVWFGDATGHDPSNGITLAIAKAALASGPGITVEAIDLGSLNDDGQVTSILADPAIDGQLFSGINTGTLVSTIQTAISTAFQNYIKVQLELPLLPPGVGVSIAPTSITGTFDRSIERVFNFDVTFTGLSVGVHDFGINATVDGGIVATETDRITVVGVPEPGSVGFGVLLLSVCFVTRLRFSRREEPTALTC